MDQLVNLALLVLSLSMGILHVTAQGKKSVTIALHSNWKDTPLHLEASEFLAEESTDIFWRYVEDLSSLGPEHIKNVTPKVYYETIIHTTSPLLSPAKLSLLKFSLALRTYSPAIQMFHQILYDKHKPECDAVVEVGGRFACDIPQLQALLQTAHERPRADVYKVDHKYPSLVASNVTAILYGEIGTANFYTLHNFLKNESESQKLEYFLRHFVKDLPDRKAQLSGYGVELNIKSTEYKAQDDTVLKEDLPQTPVKQFETEELEGFIFSQLKELYPDKQAQLEEFKSHLLESTKEIATLKVWELQDLSLQAAQRIVISPKEEALRVMRDIAQNFPTRARSLVDIKVDPSLQREIAKNQQMFIQYHNIAPPDAALFLNGLYNDVETMEVFTLLQYLKQETQILEGLHAIGVPGDKLSNLLKLDFGSDKDEFAVDFRDSSIQYVNDIEKDKAYRHWPSSLRELLRPMFPGMLRNIRKNIFHLVIIADPSKDDMKDIFKLAESFYIHNAPVRIGFIFAVNPDPEVDGFSDPGVAFLEAFNFIAQDKNPYKGLSFITDVYATVPNGEELTANAVIKKFRSVYPKEDLDLIFGADSDYDTGRKLAWDFIKRTGLGQAPIVLLNGIPLKQKSFTPEVFEDAILAEILKQTGNLQRSVYKGDLTDSDDVLDYLMSQPNVMPRLNQRILGSSSNYIDLSGKVGNLSVFDFEYLPLKDLSSTLSSSLKYLQKNMDDFLRPLSTWIVADLESPHGRHLFLDALNHIKSSISMRIALIHNPKSAVTFADNPITFAAQAAITYLEPSQAKLYLNKLLKPANAEQVIKGEKTPLDFAISTMDLEAFQHDLNNLNPDILKIHSLFCKRVLKLSPGARTIVLNGRVLGAMDPTEDFMEDDFHLLEKYSMNIFGNTLKREFKQVPNVNSDIIMKATALLLAQPQTKQRYEVHFAGDKHSVIDLPPADPSSPAHDIVAIVDPVSRSAQKLAPILSVLQKVVNTKIRIFLNSAEKHSSMPLKSFFRWVMDEEPQFPTVGEEEDESEAHYAPVAHFANLPTSPLLTLAMATPENWMVAAVQSIHDLDNIHLEKVERGVWATFELEHLILEGHCFEQNTGNPPRGLQFTLGTNSTPVQMDTIVMANLGYFQLKANPGSWILRLRQGRSADIYDIVGHENTDSPPGSSEVVTVINNFRSITIRIKVTKKPSMQYEDLLQDSDDDDQGGLWNSLANTFGSTTSKESEDPEDNRINIFSLASGHLYERLLRIMMLSVLKHTKTPVKFWFLKNYLSPTFKEFLPYMAQHYKFEYELVQYKWPRWLNQQTEKQRIIWGYKILFLDVLFPLNVKKIIFVDADQIVRTDLKELRDLDLHGAPYGYTPFCDSRTDMEGYRFWKSGYWASHMGKKKYHISALYVVDLRRFRRMAAGDRLRGQYQGLSQDPNSLSNLDQDLPNNMIHQVPIFSLPQDWLWCETWCDDESKPRAKTIDLCNNPKTKESKLKSAMRIIPEWKDYDDEIKQLIEKYEQEKAGISLPETKDPLSKGPHSEL